MKKTTWSIISLAFLVIMVFIVFKIQKTNAAETPQLQVGVMSDVHIGLDSEKMPKENFARALNDLKNVAPHYDAIAIDGDITNSGFPFEYDGFNSVLNQYKLPGAVPFVAMGNHEYFEPKDIPGSNVTDAEMQNRFEQKEQVPNIYFDKWVKGYHFITLSGEKSYTTIKKETGNLDLAGNEAYLSDAQIQWFEKTLAEKADPKKPIFVFLHQPLINTVYGSRWGTDYKEQKLLSIMKKYPQSIFFTGHSHYPISNPGSILEKDITFVNTGAVKYIDDDNGDIPKLSQGYLVNVYNDHVDIKAREFSNGTWLRTVTIKLPN